MSWIETVPPDRATGRLREMYDRIAGADGDVDRILQVHSLRPHTLEGHIALYKSVLHHTGNKLPLSLLETVGVYVSALNGCEYCVVHHLTGLRRALRDDQRFARIREALATDRLEDDVFQPVERAALAYARKLTRAPARMQPSDLQPMRAAGLDDGAILEVNQVVAYFAYANRTVQGLGVSTAGEVLGLAPRTSDDPDDWRHAEPPRLL